MRLKEKLSSQTPDNYTYSYPAGTAYIDIFGFIIIGIFAVCGGVAGAIEQLFSAEKVQHPFLGIFVSLWLLYGGFNFLYLAIWKFPHTIVIDDSGVLAWLIGNRLVSFTWKEITFFKDYSLNLVFGPAPAGLERLLIFRYYIVLHSFPFLKRFFDFKKTFKNFYMRSSASSSE